MTGFLYPVVAAWTWGGGWLAVKGYTDFAGSGIVHMTGGIAGFFATLVIGPRLGRFEPINENQQNGDLKKDAQGYKNIMDKFFEGRWDITRLHMFIRQYNQKLSERNFASHSPQDTVLGMLILWVAWLFFNGGSSFETVGASGQSASLAMVNTIVGPSAAGLTTFALGKFFFNCESRFDFPSVANGILGGLVSVTAGCDGFEPWAGFVVGVIGALVYMLSTKLMEKMKVDDPL